MEEIKQALKTLKEECKRCSSVQCESNCFIYKVLGECIAVNSVPETWEV
ncbi:hypothetical protein [Clostridium sp. 1001270J_160509_D11]|jgi:hypothetical protein|nr:hypothetical protein [Clostridium sp. 1001270J_160509_D11]